MDPNGGSNAAALGPTAGGSRRLGAGGSARRRALAGPGRSAAAARRLPRAARRRLRRDRPRRDRRRRVVDRAARRRGRRAARRAAEPRRLGRDRAAGRRSRRGPRSGSRWSESAERSMAEVGRVAALMGVFVLALAVQDRDGLRRMVGGVAAGIVLVGAVALLSRFHPAWFPDLEAPSFLPESQARLHYPLDYWNGLAAFTAIGIPLLLALATAARHPVARSLAAAAHSGARPGPVLHAFPRRRRRARGRARRAVRPPPPAPGAPRLRGAGRGRGRRPRRRGGPARGARRRTHDRRAAQGNEMLAMTIVVCAGVGADARLALALADRHGVGPRVAPAAAPPRGGPRRRRGGRNRARPRRGPAGPDLRRLGGLQGPRRARRRRRAVRQRGRERALPVLGDRPRRQRERAR